ncbi:hypothetical protein [Inhella proteolytica]|uniref:VCBS repeat-containing protein n=1 Tax=Inhella proteolytica TaxID=2795029 RepID=A0A931J1U7_9BURK|nr:hypothetical protein [Inhella proteolytica]MBH9577178.1 hypothetical protein [Inhella proteolytica]
MKISSSELELAAGHASWQRLERRETDRAWIGTRRPDFDGRPSLPTRAQFSPAAQAVAQAAPPSRPATEAVSDPAQASAEAVRHDPRMQLLRAMLWLVFGEQPPDPIDRLESPEDAPDAADLRPAETPAAASPAPAPTPAPTPPSGTQRTVEETQLSFESTRFEVQGSVRTADGRELQFELKLEMSQLHFEHRRETSAVQDPLVLNFDGPAADLLGPRWDFDLDADGVRENLPGLGPGRGWLVFDRNQDGVANDGSELFGPRSGDGFAELAALDADANGWIDENDPAWKQLNVWRPGGGLQSLGAAGVGALSLARLATPFTLRGAEGSPEGQLRSSGFYLHEDGRPGLLQQVDLRV